MPITLWLSVCSAHLQALKDARQADRERGSVTLEQVVIAAGLLAAAVGLVAVIVAVIGKYSSKIN